MCTASGWTCRKGTCHQTWCQRTSSAAPNGSGWVPYYCLVVRASEVRMTLSWASCSRGRRSGTFCALRCRLAADAKCPFLWLSQVKLNDIPIAGSELLRLVDRLLTAVNAPQSRRIYSKLYARLLDTHKIST